MSLNFINLTPHEICIYNYDGSITKFKPSGKVVRLNMKVPESVLAFDGINFAAYKDDKYSSLDHPEYMDDPESVYIVSNPVAEYCKAGNVVAPDNSPENAVRDEQGNLIGVRRFCTYWS